MVGGLVSGRMIRADLEGPADAPEELGRRVAERVVELGGKSLIDELEAPTTW
jgi:hypothetical protein